MGTARFAPSCFRGIEGVFHKVVIVAEITPASTFHGAEDHHRQYFDKRGRVRWLSSRFTREEPE